LLCKFINGETWGTIDSVAQVYSHYNKIFIDNNDRVYVFWLTNPNLYYRYFENNSWGEIICPYNDVNNNYIKSGEVDTQNNLHFVGRYDKYISYYKYDKSTEQMISPYILTYNYVYDGEDITINNQDNPHFVWHERTSDIYPYNDATIYSSFNGTTWSSPELIVEDPYSQNIVINDGKTYILNTEKEPGDNYSVVLYQKDDFNNWYGNKILMTPSGISLGDVGIINNSLYVIFWWKSDDIQYDIFFIKTKHPLSVQTLQKTKSPIILGQNFPNPFTNNTNISYTLNQTGYCSLTILNLKGELVQTLVNKKQAQGTYRVEWDGKNTKGKKLAAGIYLYRLSVDNYRMTKSLIIN